MAKQKMWKFSLRKKRRIAKKKFTIRKMQV